MVNLRRIGFNLAAMFVGSRDGLRMLRGDAN